VTTVVVTHDPAEAALLADEILVLDNGQVLQAGAVGAVFRRQANEVVARLLGAEDVGEGVAVAEDQVAIGDGATLIVSGPGLWPGTPSTTKLIWMRSGPAGSTPPVGDRRPIEQCS
jgi:ABC-type Fe3+/spermidine/putrescine transport system ATPase subunit